MIGIESVRPLATLTGRGKRNTTWVAASVTSNWSAAAAPAGGAAEPRQPRRAPAAADRCGAGAGGGGACRLGHLGLHAAAIDAGHQPAGHLDGHLRPLDVVGVVERLVKGDGTARDEGQVDILPVLAAQVLDRGPALQRRTRRRGIGRQGQAIRGLPHRHLDDVGHAHRALALAARRQFDACGHPWRGWSGWRAAPGRPCRAGRHRRIAGSRRPRG